MANPIIPIPVAGEYPPYFANYFAYIVEGTDVYAALQEGETRVATFFAQIPTDKLKFRYAENKWTSLDVLLHIIDCERVFQHRAFWIARGCAAPLAGFEQDDFVVTACANDRTVSSLIAEYRAVRAATLNLVAGLPAATLGNTGSSNGTRVSAAALIRCVVGHELHHLNVLREKYGL